LYQNEMAAQSEQIIAGESADAIARSVEAAIREGRLTAGEALPTVRALAQELRVSPTTVSGAYRRLRERGLLVTAGRRGTRVSPAPPVAAAAAPSIPEGARDLATGNPDPAMLPRLGPHLARLDPEPHLYAEEIHLPALVTLARERLRADRIPVPALSVVSGALDGIERVLAARLRPGDPVAVEDPGFAGVLHLVRALGLAMLPVAVDDAGPRPEALERALADGARAFVLTPRAQNPTGAALDAPRVRALRDVLAARPDVLVIEDDHASEAAGVPARTLCTPTTERFAVVRSVSKTLGPDLRLAILAGDPETVARVEGRQLLGSRWVSHLLQNLVVRLWKDRRVARGLERAATVYTRRREALIAALAAEGLRANGCSGMNVWVPVPEESRVVQRLASEGFAVRAGEGFRIESPPAIRITSASLVPGDAPAVAVAVARAVAGGRRTSGA
jgi:DNA-binding transcriptional MocR family regulator